MDALLYTLTLLAYLISALNYWIYLSSRRDSLLRLARIVVIGGFVFHTILLVILTIARKSLPFSTLYGMIILFSWTIILVYLIAEIKYRIPTLGSFIIPLAFLAICYAMLLPRQNQLLRPALQSIWLGLHVLIAFLGNAAFVLTFGVGLMYIIQERQVKSKKPGTFYHRLPSLDILDNLNYTALSFGFPLQTVGIISGSIYEKYAHGVYWSGSLKEILSFVTWIIFGMLLAGRFFAGWRGRRAARVAVAGFVAVVLTYIGIIYY